MKDKLLDINEMSIWDDAKHMLEKARKDGVETAWDRLAQQTPHCRFCELGTTCRNCVMGPCRISAKAEPGGKLYAGCAGQMRTSSWRATSGVLLPEVLPGIPIMAGTS